MDISMTKPFFQNNRLYTCFNTSGCKSVPKRMLTTRINTYRFTHSSIVRVYLARS